MPERLESGLLDTSVVIDLDIIDPAHLPRTLAVSLVTMAELAAGPYATPDPADRARRQDRLQGGEAAFEPTPFGSEAARAYGRVRAAVAAAERQPRRRFADLLIASIAVAEGLPLLARNAEAFAGLGEILVVVPARARRGNRSGEHGIRVNNPWELLTGSRGVAADYGRRALDEIALPTVAKHGLAALMSLSEDATDRHKGDAEG